MSSVIRKGRQPCDGCGYSGRSGGGSGFWSNLQMGWEAQG